MNQIQKQQIIRKNYHSYHIPSMPHHNTLKRNAIFINNHNTLKHELSKSLGSIMISKYSEVKFTDKIREAINLIEEEVNKIGFVENHSEFITEACPNEEPNRRVDLVNLNEPETKLGRYEFETTKIKKEGAITIYI